MVSGHQRTLSNFPVYGGEDLIFEMACAMKLKSLGVAVWKGGVAACCTVLVLVCLGPYITSKLKP